jgi:hypothetical protein
MGEEDMTAVVRIPPWSIKGEVRRRKTVKLPSNTRPDQTLRLVSKSKAVEWLELLRPDIQELGQRKGGWKGPRSHAVSLDSIAKLLGVLLDIGAYLAPPPQLVALASGGVQAEWHYSGQILEVGVNADGEVFAFADDADGSSVIELEDTWFIPSDQRMVLRRYFYSLAERIKDHS